MVTKDMVLAFADLYPQDGPIVLKSKKAFGEGGDQFNPSITIDRCRKLDTSKATIELLQLEANAVIVDFDLWYDGEVKVGDVLIHGGINWQVKKAMPMVREAMTTCTVQADSAVDP